MSRKKNSKKANFYRVMECDGDFEVASVEPLKLTKVIDEEEADEGMN